MAYNTEQIRNIALGGHSGAGKTLLAEAMIFNIGLTSRMGRIEDGTTVSDYHDYEIENQHSISLSLLAYEYQGKKINLIDTPGYIDFIGEMKAGLGVTEVACILVNASEGIEVGTELSWEYSTNNKQAI